MSIKPTYTTMGQSTPASVAAGTGYYRYRGKQPIQEAGAAAALVTKAREDKAQRFREFCQYREDGASVAQAAALIPVSVPTARGYERERLEALKESQP